MSAAVGTEICMFEISKDFTGGNIEVISQSEDEALLKKELRGTGEEWFYWAFCVRGAQGRTVKFDISDPYVGPFGPAVSHDGRCWKWLGQRDSKHGFTYTFSEDESCVFFAHSMLYHPDRFYDFCAEKNIDVKTINGHIPYVTFGEGEKYIFLTARHHACESTGSYVLEGVIDELLKNPIDGLKVICVPFVDFDGVCRGEQGKFRQPHDHNRDYDEEKEPLYESVRFIRDFAKTHQVLYAFDFHAPYHTGETNDDVFIVYKLYNQAEVISRFSDLFEKESEKNPFRYYAKNNVLPGVGGNNPNAKTFAAYIGHLPSAILSFTLETAYFGREGNVFGDSEAVGLGKNFAGALKKFHENEALKR